VIGTCECGRSGRIRRAMCDRCYDRWLRNRTEEERYRPTTQERWESKFERGAPEECWLWRGGLSKGYGSFHVSSKRGRVKAHAYAVELATGVRCPRGQGALHRCDNPPCVNPNHIYYGTQKQNSADMVERSRHPVGERRPNSRMTADQVVNIRERFAAGETFTQLKKEFGISSGRLSNIVNGHAWKHVGGPIKTYNKTGARPKSVRDQITSGAA